MYEVETMLGALVAQGKKQVDKVRKSDVKSKTIDELMDEDPLRALMHLGQLEQNS